MVANIFADDFGSIIFTLLAAILLSVLIFNQFCPEQPDLNLRNSEVRDALDDVLTFWLDQGVDGFRADAVAHLVEDSRFQDEPTKDGYDPKRPRYNDLDHVYTRSDRHHTFVIMINFSKERWEGSLNGISASGVVVIDSEMKLKGTKVSFVRVTLNKAQALVIKMQ